MDGFIEGCPLGWKEGWDVGQFETEGFLEVEGWLLGSKLIDGGSDGMNEGFPDMLGCALGQKLGEVLTEGDLEG